jgi:UDP-glucuronate 4-epimerase
MKVLVTGAAGFIGMHVCQQLLQRGDTVVGVDSLNTYYSVALKQARLAHLQTQARFDLKIMDVANREGMKQLFAAGAFDGVVHLAAQAGVRHSLIDPHAYIDSNVTGFLNVLEGCRHAQTRHLVYASSSSVYGGNSKQPYAETDAVDHPVSLYAATKKTDEIMAHSYSHLFRVPTTGLRFFTVYGPWGRPDMALFLFTKAILEGRPIDVYNNGDMMRDFTYVDDIAQAVVKVLDKVPTASGVRNDADPSTSDAPFRVFNIGNSAPMPLNTFIECIERSVGRKAVRNLMPMQPGDVRSSHADIAALAAWIGYAPQTSVAQGVENFVRWYRSYHQV